MLDIIEAASVIAGYSTVGSISGVVVWKTFFPKRPFLDNPVPLFSAVFWPIGLPAVVPLLLFSWAKKFKGFQRISIRKSAEQKVIEYSQSPKKVLAEILCAKILANVEAFSNCDDKWSSVQDGHTIIINWLSYSDGRLNSAYVNKVSVEFDRSEREKITKTLKQALKIRDQKRKADAEAQEQLKALEIVESLLLTPEKE